MPFNFPSKSWTILAYVIAAFNVSGSSAAENPSPFSADTNQVLERTCFQTGKAWAPSGNLRSEVAIVYGIDTNLPSRIATWREHGYR